MYSAFCYERLLCLEHVVSVVYIDTKHSRSTFLGEPMPDPMPEPCPRQGVDRERFIFGQAKAVDRFLLWRTG